MSHRIVTEISIGASTEDVWEVLADLDSYPEWNPFMVRAKGSIQPGAKLSLKLRAGKRSFSIGPRVVTVEPARKFEWFGKLGIGGIFDGKHSHELEEAGPNQTLYRQSEEFSGILIPLMGGLLKDTEIAFKAMNVALKRRAEELTHTRA
jgi:hypothetical protein